MEWEELKNQLMENPAFRVEYERLAADYEQAKSAIQQRIAEKQADIEATIHPFAEALKEQGLKVDKIILFGSQARGDAKEDSDIDLLVISPDFAGMPLQRRLEILGTAIARVRKPIDPLACTPEELRPENLKKTDVLYDVLIRQEIREYFFG